MQNQIIKEKRILLALKDMFVLEVNIQGRNKSQTMQIKINRSKFKRGDL